MANEFEPDLVMNAANAAGIPGADAEPAQAAPSEPDAGEQTNPLATPPEMEPQDGEPKADEKQAAPADEFNVSNLTPQQVAEMLGEDIPGLKEIIEKGQQFDEKDQLLSQREQDLRVQAQQLYDQQQMLMQQQQMQRPVPPGAVPPYQPQQAVGQPPVQADMVNLKKLLEDEPDRALDKMAEMITEMNQGYQTLQQSNQVLMQQAAEYKQDVAAQQLDAIVTQEIEGAGLEMFKQNIIDRVWTTNGTVPIPDIVQEFKQLVSQYNPNPAPKAGDEKPEAPKVDRARITAELINRAKERASNVPMKPSGKMENPRKVELADMVNSPEAFNGQITEMAQQAIDNQNII